MVLLLVLGLLLLMSGIVTKAVWDSILAAYSQRQVGNSMLARQAAEAALSAGATALEAIQDFHPEAATGGCLQLAHRKIALAPATPAAAEIWRVPEIWLPLPHQSVLSLQGIWVPAAIAAACSGASSPLPELLARLAAPPKYLLEHLTALPTAAGQADLRLHVFRVTALGIGATDDASLLLQATYQAPFTLAGARAGSFARLSWRQIPLQH